MGERREKPILFSGPLVRAILDGRKTQTRRVVKPQPEPGTDCPYHVGVGEQRRARRCPYGAPGDLLWVRETWAVEATSKNGGMAWVSYRAGMRDGSEARARNDRALDVPLKQGVHGPVGDTDGVWRPSLHMPRWASRLTLRVTEVRVERVQEISAEDAMAEGVALPVGNEAFGWDPRSAFRDLWDAINGKRPGCAWRDNPWVFVVSFERVEAGQ